MHLLDFNSPVWRNDQSNHKNLWSKLQCTLLSRQNQHSKWTNDCNTMYSGKDKPAVTLKKWCEGFTEMEGWIGNAQNTVDFSKGGFKPLDICHNQ